jgi:hypothetical protein
MANEEAMKALMNIEGFRNLNQDIETIINKSEAVKKAKKEANDQRTDQKEKKELNRRRKGIQEPEKANPRKANQVCNSCSCFYVPDRLPRKKFERCYHTIRTWTFKKVTGLSVKDFELLVSLGVFNSALMNDAVYKFKRYEDASLEYIGINRHEGEDIGLFDTVLSRKDYEESFVNSGNMQS